MVVWKGQCEVFQGAGKVGLFGVPPLPDDPPHEAAMVIRVDVHLDIELIAHWRVQEKFPLYYKKIYGIKPCCSHPFPDSKGIDGLLNRFTVLQLCNMPSQ